MMHTMDPNSNNSKDVSVFDIIPEDVRSQLEILDLEDEEEEEAEDVEVFDILPDDVRSRLGVLDLEDE